MMYRLKRQQGLTFIELSLTLVILGLIASLLAGMAPAVKRLAVVKAAVYDEVQAHDAMVGFALATGRLPCADTNYDGVENCPATTGSFPYLTLGMGKPLRNANGHDYHYSVYFRPATADQDADLTKLKNRWDPTLASGLPPAAALTNFAHRNHLDFCQGLSAGLTNNLVNDALHVTQLTSNEAIAYVLVNPGNADLNGNGSLFDGINATGLGFEHPNRSADSHYDDSVNAGYFTILWERMGCSGLLSTAGHAHPNTLSSLAMFRQSLRDYKKQLKLTEEMAAADIVQQAASVAGAAAGVATAAATAPTATASALNTFGATGGAVVASGSAIFLNGAALTEAGLSQYVVVKNHEYIKARLEEVGTLINELDQLHSNVAINTEQADNRVLSHQ